MSESSESIPAPESTPEITSEPVPDADLAVTAEAPLAAATPAPPAPGAPTMWPAAGYAPAQPAGWSQPVAYPAATTSSNAIIALILAVVSWAVCPIVAAVVALVLAHTAAKEIAASGGRIEGAGLVTAARIVAWVNIGVMAALLVIGLFFLVLAAIVSSTS